jgi:hypothetical protein
MIKNVCTVNLLKANVFMYRKKGKKWINFLVFLRRNLQVIGSENFKTENSTMGTLNIKLTYLVLMQKNLKYFPNRQNLNCWGLTSYSDENVPHEYKQMINVS